MKLADQNSFQSEELEPRLAEAQAGERAVFLDAAHAGLPGLLGLSRVLHPHLYSLTTRA